MIKKIISIDSCEHCPLSYYNDTYIEYICEHPDTEGMVIKDRLIIHPDCPLNDDNNQNEITAKMENVYKEVNNATVILEVDKNDLIIRIPYPTGDPEDIINLVKD